jgi:hypothetical protein
MPMIAQHFLVKMARNVLITWVVIRVNAQGILAGKIAKLVRANIYIDKLLFSISATKP